MMVINPRLRMKCCFATLLLFVLVSCSPAQTLCRQSSVVAGTTLRENEPGQESWMVDPPQEIVEQIDDLILDAKRRQREQEEQREARRRAEQEEFERQINIEKFKRTLLQRLHLSAPPDFARHGGIANRTNAKRVLRSLPLALQRRLLTQLRAEEVITEPPPDRTDERETLILLKHLHWKLPKVSSATFGIDMADDIDPGRIQSALLQFETKNPLLKGQRLEVWEVFLTQEEEDELMNNDLDPSLLKQYNNITWMFDRHPSGYTSLPAPAVIRGSLDSVLEPHRSGSIRIREGRLAETHVPHRPGLVQITFEISGPLAQWMSHRQRMPMMRKLIRSIIVICPNCDSRTDPVDVNKGILEIRHRSAVRRTRRSLDANGSNNVTIGNPCSPKGHKFSCCTQSFSLNFEDVGWNNWILHPKTVVPNYCHGSCQVNGIKKTPHSDLMHLYRSQKYDHLSEVQREAMLSCCHPVKMASISALYVDPDNELRMDTLHNIIVLECGCS
ncbi:hypothetical protein Aperf_G00000114518 [Anoplocephala perfoliata]